MSLLKTAVFIDGAATWKMSKSLGFDMDWKLFRDWLDKMFAVQRVHYYSLVWTTENADDADDVDYSPILPLLDWMEYNRYMVHKKTAKQIADGNGKKSLRGSFVGDMSVDMMNAVPYLEHIIYVGGSSDMLAAISDAQRKGVVVTVISSIAQGGFVDDVVRRKADRFIEIDKMKNEIMKKVVS